MTDDGPWFEDLEVGRQLAPAPAITVGPGESAAYQAIVGDPLRLPLSAPLSEAVTGDSRRLVNPGLVLQVAIGQSTVATRRVIANLFYRHVWLRRPVRHGDTLTTTVTVRGRREASRRPGRPPRGLVLLGISTVDQDGEVVVDFERCALLPFGDPDAVTGAADDLGSAATGPDLDDAEASVPPGWDLSPLGPPDTWSVGEERIDPLRDTVSDALALVRLTQNLAAAHRDPARGQNGRRLVYGGHTIGLAQASLARLLPSMATLVGWVSCDHLAPVFEGDVIGVTATLDVVAEASAGRLLAFTVTAETERDGQTIPVLGWRPVVYAP